MPKPKKPTKKPAAKVRRKQVISEPVKVDPPVKPYKLVYFNDRSTAVMASRVQLGVNVFSGTMDECVEAQNALTWYDNGLSRYQKSPEETANVIKKLQESWASG